MVRNQYCMRKDSKKIFIINQTGGGRTLKGYVSIGGSQPPKNNTEESMQIINMLAYSLKKKIAHLKPEYSVIQPATSSDSASGISNGVLLVSARPEIKNIKKAINVKGL